VEPGPSRLDAPPEKDETPTIAPGAGLNEVGAGQDMVQDHDMEPVGIREAGLSLRPFRAADAEAVYAACQDPEIQRWTTVPRPYLRQHAAEFVTGYAEQAWLTGTGAPLGVFDAGTGELLGSNGLIMVQRDYRLGEVGYWVAPWARGRGVATTATRAVARWGLDVLGLERIAWRAELGNHASRVVAHRLGFGMEGILRSGAPTPDGHRVDCWTASLRPGELREPSDPMSAADLLAILQAGTFGRPRPELAALTPSGARVVLRAPTAHDVDALVAACGDPETRRWTTVPDPYGRAQAEVFLAERVARRWAAGAGLTCAIADGEDRFAGTVELRLRPHDPAVATVGFLVAPWARGLGYATAALVALCRWGFEALGLRRIEWHAYVGNQASRRVAQKAGFTIEGVARSSSMHRGEPRDSWTGAMLAADRRWAAPGPGAGPAGVRTVAGSGGRV
jgi:RimJ/RimL family protein N-acetyltransferase